MERRHYRGVIVVGFVIYVVLCCIIVQLAHPRQYHVRLALQFIMFRDSFLQGVSISLFIHVLRTDDLSRLLDELAHPRQFHARLILQRASSSWIRIAPLFYSAIAVRHGPCAAGRVCADAVGTASLIVFQ